MVAQPPRQKQQVAISAALFLGIFDVDAFKTFADGAGAFIGGEDAFARRGHGLGDGREIVC